MMGIIIVVVVGVRVASVVAFGANVLLPASNSNATEDRLAAMASRKRDGGADAHESGSLMVGDWDDDDHPLGKLMQNMPALRDYLEQADVQRAPSKFGFICLAAFGAGQDVVGLAGGGG